LVGNSIERHIFDMKDAASVCESVHFWVGWVGCGATGVGLISLGSTSMGLTVIGLSDIGLTIMGLTGIARSGTWPLGNGVAGTGLAGTEPAGMGLAESGRYKFPFLPQPAKVDKAVNKTQINSKFRMGSL
jgi:hypothetical protein